MELLDGVTPELSQPLYLLLQLGKASCHSTKLRIRVFDGCDALELPRLGPVVLRHVAIIGDHYDPRLRWKR